MRIDFRIIWARTFALTTARWCLNTSYLCLLHICDRRRSFMCSSLRHTDFSSVQIPNHFQTKFQPLNLTSDTISHKEQAVNISPPFNGIV